MECEKGHQWPRSLSLVAGKNQWCYTCNKKRECSISQAFEIAKNKEGKLLTDPSIFTNGIEKLTNVYKLNWECKLGHKFPMCLNKIKSRDSWCPKCSGTFKYTYEEVKQEIELRGWQLLDREYKNDRTELDIKCKNNHEFTASLNKILHRGKGCKYCNARNVGENICRIYLETIFNSKFTCTRPKYMEYLELDGYCSELGIAFEHHGLQHYSFENYKKFKWAKSKTEDDFIALQNRDRRKIELCKLFGIKLIIIPNLFEMTKLRNLMSFIKTQCDLLNIETPNDIFKLKIDLSWAYNRNNNLYMLNQFKDLNEQN